MKPKINCYRCKKDYPISMFGKNKAKKSGLFSWCKPCQAEYAREYTGTTARFQPKLNPEKVIEIRNNYGDVKELARKYGVSLNTIYKVQAGTTWRWVKESK